MYRLLIVIGLCAMLGACVSPGQMGVSDKAWKQAAPDQKKSWRQAYQLYLKTHPVLPGNPNGDLLQVDIAGGQAHFPPDFKESAFQPIHVTLLEGGCQRVRVMSEKEGLTNMLYMCFDQHTLALDPAIQSQNSRFGSLIIPQNPLWKRPNGWMYTSMASEGLVSLKQANIRLLLHEGVS